MYLTTKENDVVSKLKEDFESTGKSSFFYTLLVGICWSKTKDFEDKLLDGVEERHKPNMLNCADWLFCVGETVFVGKYKKHFFVLNNEGQIWSLGQEIQNIVYEILSMYYGNLVNDYEDVCLKFKEELNIDLDAKINDYKKFCEELGLEYNPSPSKFDIQNKDFPMELEKEIFG